ncbi:hypothetical protein M5D96_012306 [Drosophila gunungcola]|uniref:Uncharacterized protein n=1 Tax=Drosophila gunungcola TaxID=103775 RepID=A0A9P9YDC9_9MUSC|nr:hypothetical protein M5D96_012306 [Drosophila gunungcola]
MGTKYFTANPLITKESISRFVVGRPQEQKALRWTWRCSLAAPSLSCFTPPISPILQPI